MQTNKNNKVLKAGFWYTISNFFVKGIIFLTTPIFTRIMSTKDIGLFSNITTWVSILCIITTFEIYSSVSIARFEYKNNLNEYISSTLILGTIITSFFYVITIIFKDFFMNLFEVDFSTLNLIYIYLLVYPSVQMLLIKNQINYDYKSTIIVSFLNAIFSTIFSVLFVLIFSNKLMGRIYGYFIPMIIISMVVYINLLKKGKKISTKYWPYALMISFPLIFHLLAGYLLNSSDKIMINKIVSPEANAIYSVAYTLSLVVSILWSSMNNAWSPWAYKQMDDKNIDSLKRLSKPYIIFFLVIVCLIMLFAPECILIFAGKKYTEASGLIPPIMLGYIFQFVYSLYVNIEFYYKKQKYIAFGTVSACIINIVLNLIYIPIYGYNAAAYTTLIGYMFLFVIHFLLVKKMGYSYYYDNAFFIKCLLFSTFYMFICVFLYKFIIIRYLCIIMMVLFLILRVINRKKDLMDALKSREIEKIFNVLMGEGK